MHLLYQLHLEPTKAVKTVFSTSGSWIQGQKETFYALSVLSSLLFSGVLPLVFFLLYGFKKIKGVSNILNNVKFKSHINKMCIFSCRIVVLFFLLSKYSAVTYYQVEVITGAVVLQMTTRWHSSHMKYRRLTLSVKMCASLLLSVSQFCFKIY